MTREIDQYTFCPQCKTNLVQKKIDSEDRKVCLQCIFIFWNNPKPVVSIILSKEGKMLMLQRSKDPFKDFWVLPGGFIGFSETADEAIKRETKEEAGIIVAINGIVGIYQIDNDPRGMHIDIIYHGSFQDEIKLNDGNSAWKYFSPDELPDKIAYKHRDAINDWYTRKHQYG